MVTSLLFSIASILRRELEAEVLAPNSLCIQARTACTSSASRRQSENHTVEPANV